MSSLSNDPFSSSSNTPFSSSSNDPFSSLDSQITTLSSTLKKVSSVDTKHYILAKIKCSETEQTFKIKVKTSWISAAFAFISSKLSPKSYAKVEFGNKKEMQTYVLVNMKSQFEQLAAYLQQLPPMQINAQSIDAMLQKAGDIDAFDDHIKDLFTNVTKIYNKVQENKVDVKVLRESLDEKEKLQHTWKAIRKKFENQLLTAWEISEKLLLSNLDLPKADNFQEIFKNFKDKHDDLLQLKAKVENDNNNFDKETIGDFKKKIDSHRQVLNLNLFSQFEILAKIFEQKINAAQDVDTLHKLQQEHDELSKQIQELEPYLDSAIKNKHAVISQHLLQVQADTLNEAIKNATHLPDFNQIKNMYQKFDGYSYFQKSEAKRELQNQFIGRLEIFKEALEEKRQKNEAKMAQSKQKQGKIKQQIEEQWKEFGNIGNHLNHLEEAINQSTLKIPTYDYNNIKQELLLAIQLLQKVFSPQSQFLANQKDINLENSQKINKEIDQLASQLKLPPRHDPQFQKALSDKFKELLNLASANLRQSPHFKIYEAAERDLRQLQNQVAEADMVWSIWKKGLSSFLEDEIKRDPKIEEPLTPILNILNDPRLPVENRIEEILGNLARVVMFRKPDLIGTEELRQKEKEWMAQSTYHSLLPYLDDSELDQFITVMPKLQSEEQKDLVMIDYAKKTLDLNARLNQAQEKTKSAEKLENKLFQKHKSVINQITSFLKKSAISEQVINDYIEQVSKLKGPGITEASKEEAIKNARALLPDIGKLNHRKEYEVTAQQFEEWEKTHESLQKVAESIDNFSKVQSLTTQSQLTRNDRADTSKVNTELTRDIEEAQELINAIRGSE